MAIWRKVPNKAEENETKNKCETEEKSTVVYDTMTGYTFRTNTIAVNGNDILEKEKKEMNKNEEMTMNENNNVKLVSPWAEHARKIEALFESDPDVKVEYNNDVPEVTLYVIGIDKADALTKLLPVSKNFGSIELKITVIPNNVEAATPDQLFRKAFFRNPAFNFAETVHNVLMSNPTTYIVFKPEIVQYYNDDIGDYFGHRSTLYQYLAKEVFNDIPGVYYSTNEVDK